MAGLKPLTPVTPFPLPVIYFPPLFVNIDRKMQPYSPINAFHFSSLIFTSQFCARFHFPPFFLRCICICDFYINMLQIQLRIGNSKIISLHIDIHRHTFERTQTPWAINNILFSCFFGWKYPSVLFLVGAVPTNRLLLFIYTNQLEGVFSTTLLVEKKEKLFAPKREKSKGAAINYTGKRTAGDLG